MDLGAGALAGFLLTALIVEITPGPNMVWLALVSATEGRRTGLAAVLGITLGLAVQGVLAVAGVNALFDAVPAAYEALRAVGAGYLLWLAIESWRDAGNPAHHLPGGGEGPVSAFRSGLVTNLLNPKSALVYLALLPGFLPQGADWTATTALVALYMMVAALVHLAICLAAAQTRRMTDNPVTSAWLHRVQALALVAVSGWVLAGT